MDFLNRFVEKGLIDKLDGAGKNSEFVRCTYTDAIEILEKSEPEPSSIPYPGAAICRPSTSAT